MVKYPVPSLAPPRSLLASRLLGGLLPRPLLGRVEQRDELLLLRELLEQVDEEGHVVVLAPAVLALPAGQLGLLNLELPRRGERASVMGTLPS